MNQSGRDRTDRPRIVITQSDMETSYEKQPGQSDEVEIDRALDEARTKMQSVYEENRQHMRELLEAQQEQQRAYQALKSQSEAFESQAIEATQGGDRAAALSFITQKQALTSALTTLGDSLTCTNRAVESVTVAIAKQREQIEQVAFEAILLKSQLAAAEIQNRIAETLGQMDFGGEFKAFDAGAEIVHSLDAENLARSEIFEERLDYQVALLDESVAQESADDELKRLEARFGHAGIALPEGDFSDDESTAQAPVDSSADSDQAFLDSIDATIRGLGLEDQGLSDSER